MIEGNLPVKVYWNAGETLLGGLGFELANGQILTKGWDVNWVCPLPRAIRSIEVVFS